MDNVIIQHANGEIGVHQSRKQPAPDPDSLAARQRALKIEALAHKKELEKQIADMQSEIAEIDEAFGFSGDEAPPEKKKSERKPRTASSLIDGELSNKLIAIIADYRTKGISLATLAEQVDAPKEVVEKAIKAAVKAGTVKAVGAARARKYHPVDVDE